MMKSVIAATLLSVLAATAGAADTEVFSWKSGGSTVYSDTPVNMKMGQSNVVNIRTGTVTPPAPREPSIENLSLADQQAVIAQRIANQNKQIEDANAKMVAETKAENCRAARLNLETVEKTNARNKNQLIPRYNADIAKYCN